jgi:hypothetical protein
MTDLGFPADAVSVVKDLSDGATTSSSTSAGQQDKNYVKRGTIQGDTLSPSLPLIP